MYGMTGNGEGDWTIDIFWGNAIKHKKRAIQHIQTFKAARVTKEQVRSRYQELKSSAPPGEPCDIVGLADAMKQSASSRAKKKATQYLAELRETNPIKDRPDPTEIKNGKNK